MQAHLLTPLEPLGARQLISVQTTTVIPCHTKAKRSSLKPIIYFRITIRISDNESIKKIPFSDINSNQVKKCLQKVAKMPSRPRKSHFLANGYLHNWLKLYLKEHFYFFLYIQYDKIRIFFSKKRLHCPPRFFLHLIVHIPVPIWKYDMLRLERQQPEGGFLRYAR